MRWHLSWGGDSFIRSVDAHHYECDRIQGTRFFNADGDVVCTISPFVYVRVEPVPTARLRKGPRDGQVAAMPQQVPERIFFYPIIALGEDGKMLAPVPIHQLCEPVDVYVHAFDCPCFGTRRGSLEHIYGWSRDMESIVPDLGLEAQRG